MSTQAYTWSKLAKLREEMLDAAKELTDKAKELEDRAFHIELDDEAKSVALSNEADVASAKAQGFREAAALVEATLYALADPETVAK